MGMEAKYSLFSFFFGGAPEIPEKHSLSFPRAALEHPFSFFFFEKTETHIHKTDFFFPKNLPEDHVLSLSFFFGRSENMGDAALFVFPAYSLETSLLH